MSNRERQGEKESKRFRVSSSILRLIVGIWTESAGTHQQFQLRHTPVGVRIGDDAGRFLVSQSLFEKKKKKKEKKIGMSYNKCWGISKHKCKAKTPFSRCWQCEEKREPVCHVFVGHVASLAVSLYSHLRLWLLACPSTVEDSKEEEEEEENTVPSRLESQGPPASSFTHYEYLCALQQMARTVLCIVHVLYPPIPKKKTLHSHFIERCSTAFSTVESNGLSSV